MSDDMNFNQSYNLPISNETKANDLFKELFSPKEEFGMIVTDEEDIQINNTDTGTLNRVDIYNRKIKNLNEPNISEENFEKIKRTMEAVIKNRGDKITGTTTSEKTKVRKSSPKNPREMKTAKASPKSSKNQFKSLPELRNLDFISDFDTGSSKLYENRQGFIFDSPMIETPKEHEIFSNSKIEKIILKENQESFEKLVDMFVEPAIETYRKSPISNFNEENKNRGFSDFSCKISPYLNRDKEIGFFPYMESNFNNKHSESPNSLYHPAIAPCLYTRTNYSSEFPNKNSFNFIRNPLDNSTNRQFTFKIRLKLFKRKKLSEDQFLKIEKILSTEPDIRFKFYQTISAVADILNLPKPSPLTSHNLRQMHSVFSKHGGIISTPISVLNSIKIKNLKDFIKYQSYVLPLERFGEYVPIKKRTDQINCTKDELIGLMCTGIYDDIFFFFQQIEKFNVPAVLINELLSIFFLTSEILYKNFDFLIPYLFVISKKIGDKPYRTILEKMNSNILYNFQILVFKAIIKFEKNKSNKQVLSDEISECMIECIVKRKSLKKFLDIVSDDIPLSNFNSGTHNNHFLNKNLINTSFEDEILVVKFLGINHLKVHINDKIVEILLNVCKFNPALVLRASRNLSSDFKLLSLLYDQISVFVKHAFEMHINTLRNKILLKDNMQLEDIIVTFLPILGITTQDTLEIISIIEQYLAHLRLKRVYFSKKGSSNVRLILLFLKQYITGVKSSLQVF